MSNGLGTSGKGDLSTTSTIYNIKGRPTATFDANGQETNIADYDCDDLFPRTVTMAYNAAPITPETTITTHDCVTGKAVTFTDANGSTTTAVLNNLGRTTQLVQASGAPQQRKTHFLYPSPFEVDTASDLSSFGDGILKAAKETLHRFCVHSLIA